MRRTTTCVMATLAVLTAGVASAAPKALAATDAAARAATWLEGQPITGLPAGQQADVMVALRLTGTSARDLTSRRRALARTAPGYAKSAGASAKVVMGAVAAGANPRRLGGVDYLARIAGTRRGAGRYGTTAFDQALAMLAMRAATGRVPRAAARTLIGLRSGPGWNLALTSAEEPDIDSTALAIIALRAAGTSCRSSAITGARRWIARQRVAGGWTAYSGSPPSANSTALVARSDIACGGRATRALALLRSLQQRSGAIRYTTAEPESRLLATTESVPALAGVSLARGLRPDLLTAARRAAPCCR